MNGRVWTKEEDDLLRELYVRPDVMCKEISERLGRSRSGIYGRAKLLGLRAPAEKASIAGRMSSQNPNAVASRFRKGHVPGNKGKKMRPDTYARCAPTMFRKGHRPSKWRPVGSWRINVDGYVEVKVSDAPPKWLLKHRIVWEQANGPIPPGYNVQFRNGNRLDCRLENLYLIDRREQFMTQNSIYARYPKELQYVMKLKGALNRQIHRREKDAEQ